MVRTILTRVHKGETYPKTPVKINKQKLKQQDNIDICCTCNKPDCKTGYCNNFKKK